jgi:chitodextrinase
VRATDAAGNLSTYSNTAGATTPTPDTQPPTQPGTLTASAVSTTEVDLAWGASSDNVGVTGYLVERCQGAGCSSFTQIGTPTGTSYKDVGVVASTSYSYRVRATDAAGNHSTYSNTAGATTPAAPSGLVAAYGFNEGTGTTATDASGNGHNGTITSATWAAAGKYGGALQFNGTSALVTIPDAASLDLASGMTLEAWVNPSSVSAAWRDVIYKGVDNFYLEATSGNGGVPDAGLIAGGSYADTYGKAVLPTNTWSFLTETYDGSTVRLYVNGIQVASTAHTGSIATSTNPLQIGGDSIYGQYFAGLIDNVRVYNVALSAAQIQTDQLTGVIVGPDTTPPSQPGTLTATAVSATEADLGWGASNDNVAVTGYSIERCQGAGCTNYTGIATTTGTSYQDTGVSPSTSYSYRVRAFDAASNFSAYSNTSSAATPSGYSVSGSVSGVLGTVVLQDNAGDNLTVTANGTFTFATLVVPGAAYNVTVQTNPTSQTCTVANGTGTATGNITNVAVTCITVASDNFNRANGPLGSGWTDMTGAGLAISNQMVVGTSSSGISGDLRTAESYANDQYSQVTVTSTALSGTQYIGPVVRAQNGGQNLYAGRYEWNKGSPQLTLYKRVSGTWTQLGTSYSSGTLAAGTQLTLTVIGNTLAFSQNGTPRVTASDNTLASGSPGIVASGTASADNWAGGTAVFQVDYLSTDANGVDSYDVLSASDGYGAQVLRVLRPTHPAAGVAHNFLFVLPVQAGLGTTYGDGLATMQAADAQDQYNLTIIEPSFANDPWYANHATDPNLQYETFMTNELVPWVKAHLATTGTEQDWLIGFSKSGIGGQDLILKHPDLFNLAASWDFPADMSTYDQFGTNSSAAYGTQANFAANYELTGPFVDARKAPFQNKNRIWIGGYNLYQQDVADYDSLLTSEGIMHTDGPSQMLSHRWDSGWVPQALATLYQDSLH